MGPRPASRGGGSIRVCRKRAKLERTRPVVIYVTKSPDVLLRTIELESNHSYHLVNATLGIIHPGAEDPNKSGGEGRKNELLKFKEDRAPRGREGARRGRGKRGRMSRRRLRNRRSSNDGRKRSQGSNRTGQKRSGGRGRSREGSRGSG
ncbi:hypothetical protein AMTR_s00020p00246070 [Amborella trichopoda]|uniref:Uncharacterized protein n=1 Tax=Amborella trichopoda TaxID=13333 RepID=W1PW22_AMBTC|nr:hypothetical protein AMTR_s00020p00246070 [Amborella trichopoda]